tara:strand:+ start:2099 stop:3859 length:1761 start_codon:yes stop_codon:yes gene_type:complete
MKKFNTLITNNKISSFERKDGIFEIFYEDENYLLNGESRFFDSTKKIATLINQIIENPTSTLNKIDGEFAFSIFLKKSHKLLLARDHVGFRNLYYFIEDNKIAVSSNVYDLLSKKTVRAFDINGVIDFLFYEYINDPSTLFKNIFTVERGTFIRICTKKSKIIDKVMFRKKLSDIAENKFLSEKEIIKNVYDKIIKAHSKRQSEKNAVLLSGGVDSSIMALALSQDLGDQNLVGLSFDTVNAEQSEIYYAKMVSKKLGIRHEIVQFDPTKSVNLFDIVDNSNVPYIGNIVMSELMTQSTLDNDYNIFAGQDTRILTPAWYKIDCFNMRYMNNNVLNIFIKNFGLAAFTILGYNSKWKQKVASRMHSVNDKREYMLKNLFHYHPFADINDKNNVFISKNVKSKMSQLELNDNLLSMHNEYTDMSIGWQHNDDIAYMSNSIERRGFKSSMPFMDNSLVNFGASISFNIKSKTTKGKSGYGNKSKKVNKYLLREAFKDRLPNELIFRDKAVAIVNHIFLNEVMGDYIRKNFASPALKTCDIYEKLDLKILYEKAMIKNGAWGLKDYHEASELHNLVILDVIARKYNIVN